MRAAWYENQGAARDVLVVGEMPDPSPAAGEVRIRIVASGINPGDVKKRQDSSALACHTRASFRTAMAPGESTRSAKASLLNGSAGRCGVTAHNPIGLSARQRSLQLCRWIMWRSCLRAYRRRKALALGYLASRLIALSMSGATCRGGQCWSKEGEALLECVQQRSRVMPARA
jgi:hypothetical protein